jgi:hypothetical protein
MNRSPWLWAAIVAAATIAVSLTGVGQQFFASLRIEKPASVNAPTLAGPNANGGLKDIIGGMIADRVNVTLDEADEPASGVEAAGQRAGFSLQLPGARKDAPALMVIGARESEMTVSRAQLTTILVAAGKPSANLPPSLDGARVVFKTPRAIRAQYGNCPAPVANTLQNQIQGPPPPSTENADCIVLVEGPRGVADIPSGLDIEQLVDIGIELSGMSPVQGQAFQKAIDWKSMLSLSLPRFMRSCDSVDVNGVQGMLLGTAGRRGPTYELIWAKNGMVYSLTGYGSSGDALPMARSIS